MLHLLYQLVYGYLLERVSAKKLMELSLRVLIVLLPLLLDVFIGAASKQIFERALIDELPESFVKIFVSFLLVSVLISIDKLIARSQDSFLHTIA